MKITLVVDDRIVLDAEEYDSYVFASATKTDEDDKVGVMSSVNGELTSVGSLVSLLIDKVQEAYKEATKTTEVIQ